jgi:mRNA interferase MazF
MAKPRRGEVWQVDFDPAAGAEIAKARPAVVISDDAIGVLPLRIVVPITGWDSRYAANPWMIRVRPLKANGLTKESAADAFQVKSVSEGRLKKRLGTLMADEVEEIAAAIGLCIGLGAP